MVIKERWSPASAQSFTRGFTVSCLCIHRLELLQLAIMLTGQMRGGLTMLAELSRRGEFGVKSRASRQQHACPLQFLSVFSEWVGECLSLSLCSVSECLSLPLCSVSRWVSVLVSVQWVCECLSLSLFSECVSVCPCLCSVSWRLSLSLFSEWVSVLVSVFSEWVSAIVSVFSEWVSSVFSEQVSVSLSQCSVSECPLCSVSKWVCPCLCVQWAGECPRKAACPDIIIPVDWAWETKLLLLLLLPLL